MEGTKTIKKLQNALTRVLWREPVGWDISNKLLIGLSNPCRSLQPTLLLMVNTFFLKCTSDHASDPPMASHYPWDKVFPG